MENDFDDFTEDDIPPEILEKMRDDVQELIWTIQGRQANLRRRINKILREWAEEVLKKKDEKKE